MCSWVWRGQPAMGQWALVTEWAWLEEEDPNLRDREVRLKSPIQRGRLISSTQTPSLTFWLDWPVRWGGLIEIFLILFFRSMIRSLPLPVGVVVGVVQCPRLILPSSCQRDVCLWFVLLLNQICGLVRGGEGGEWHCNICFVGIDVKLSWFGKLLETIVSLFL